MASTRKGNDGLLLYHFDSSFYSTKVRLALAVKGLSYKKQTVLSPIEENFEPWYMRLNPTGLVPVLVHDGKVISDSTRIVDYLDTVFHDRGPRLAPPVDTDLGRRVRHFRDLLDVLPVELYSFGTVYHPDLAKDPMVTESMRRKARSALGPSTARRLHDLAAMHPDLAEAYTRKADKVGERIREREDRDLIVRLLDELEVVLDEVEKELEERKKEKEASGQQQWLCGESFTAADVMLSCLLHRLKYVGLSHRSTQKRPLLDAYYLQVQLFAPFQAEVMYTTNLLYLKSAKEAKKYTGYKRYKSRYIRYRSGYIRYRSGYIRYTSGYILYRSGYVRYRSGYIRYKSGFIRYKSGYIRQRYVYMRYRSRYIRYRSGYIRYRSGYTRYKSGYVHTLQARLALAVKGLSYRKRTVLIPGEIFEPLYIRINPAGLVPYWFTTAKSSATAHQQWLCGGSFTAADVMLSCLLHRLKFVGLSHRSTQKRPLLDAYYLQAKQFAPFQ
ncbi:GDAP1 [Branchiostoma lanceolatum]|uniref:GDAP1 protein n=1 Tax=Branchiostoma lanceolatum TaxID=7740 RepID=A0A8K0E8N1_BRALA|nr:GDAP1 [Branchiostoma lanceolatum]